MTIRTDATGTSPIASAVERKTVPFQKKEASFLFTLTMDMPVTAFGSGENGIELIPDTSGQIIPIGRGICRICVIHRMIKWKDEIRPGILTRLNNLSYHPLK